MSSIIVLGVATLTFFIVWHRVGGAAASFVAVIAACALSTIELLSVGSSTAITAIAPAAITFSTYQLALVAGFLTLPRQTLRNISLWFWLFLLFVIVFVIVQGIVSPHTVSGVLHWLWAILAWGLAGAIAEARVRDHVLGDRWVAVPLACIVGWHAVLAALQLMGLRGVSSIGVGSVELARVSGSAGHSGNLGKVMFLLIVLLLPLTRSVDKVARRSAIVGVIVAAVLTGLSFSRANTVAVLTLAALWMVLGPGIRMANRILVPLIGLIVALPVIDVLLLRNEYDPEGGSRPLLLASALKQISETFWFGVGPNNYLETVGKFDPLAAGGLPVHSAFLLSLAELGIICSVLVAMPFVLLAARSFSNARRGEPARAYAIAALAAAPGMILIAATSWGILRDQYLVMLFFVLGYVSSAQRAGGASAPMLDTYRLTRTESTRENHARAATASIARS